MQKKRNLTTLMLSIMLVACSAQQVEVSQALVRQTADDGVYMLEQAVIIEAKNTKDLTLRSGTRWSRIGEIEQGVVYDTKDQVVIVNSFDVHEASIVVRDSTIVGYYLEVEETFVETDPVTIALIGE